MYILLLTCSFNMWTTFRVAVPSSLVLVLTASLYHFTLTLVKTERNNFLWAADWSKDWRGEERYNCRRWWNSSWDIPFYSSQVKTCFQRVWHNHCWYLLHFPYWEGLLGRSKEKAYEHCQYEKFPVSFRMIVEYATSWFIHGGGSYSYLWQEIHHKLAMELPLCCSWSARWLWKRT